MQARRRGHTDRAGRWEYEPPGGAHASGREPVPRPPHEKPAVPWERRPFDKTLFGLSCLSLILLSLLETLSAPELATRLILAGAWQARAPHSSVYRIGAISRRKNSVPPAHVYNRQMRFLVSACATLSSRPGAAGALHPLCVLLLSARVACAGGAPSCCDAPQVLAGAGAGAHVRNAARLHAVAPFRYRL